jgi:TonB family protein
MQPLETQMSTPNRIGPRAFGRGLLALCALLALAAAAPRAAWAIGTHPAPPDSAILARLRDAAEVRVGRLELAGEWRCRTGPGADSCMDRNRVRAWVPVPDSSWARRLTALIATPASYDRGWSAREYTFAPEIGAQFRGPSGVVDVVLCYSCGRLRINSGVEPEAAADHRFHGEIGSVLAPFIRLAKDAFPQDEFIQSWPDSAGEDSVAPRRAQRSAASASRAGAAGQEDAGGAETLPDVPQAPYVAYGEPRFEPEKYVPYDVEPVLVKSVPSQYPEEARSRGLAGRVLLEVLVNERGIVECIEVIGSVPLLDAAAVAAVRQYRYRPATDHGELVAVWVTVPVLFTPPPTSAAPGQDPK